MGSVPRCMSYNADDDGDDDDDNDDDDDDPLFNMYIYIIRKRDFLSSAAKKRGPRSDRQNLYVRRVLSGEFVQAWWIVRI